MVRDSVQVAAAICCSVLLICSAVGGAAAVAEPRGGTVADERDAVAETANRGDGVADDIVTRPETASAAPVERERGDGGDGADRRDSVGEAGGGDGANATGPNSGPGVASDRTAPPGRQEVVHPADRKPPVFETNVTGAGAARVGRTTTVRVTLTPLEEVEDTTVRVPEYPFFEVEGREVYLGSVAPSEPQTVAVTVTPGMRLRRTVQLTITGRRKAGQFERTVQVVVDASGGTGGTTTLPNSSVRVTTVDENATDHRTDEVSTAASPATVEGQVVFPSPTGGMAPGRQLDVTLWAVLPDDRRRVTHKSSGSNRRAIATTTTDDSGRFRFSGWWYIGLPTPKRVYVTVASRNSAATAVRQTITGEELTTVSTGVQSIGAGQRIDYGQFAPTSTGPAYQSVDWALDEYRYLKRISDRFGGRVFYEEDPLGQVRIEWPKSDWPSYNFRYSDDGRINSGRIELPDRSVAGWGRTTVLHEYAHALMYTEVYEDDFDNVPNQGSYDGHSISSETDPGFALVEGFAEFMQAAVDDDPTNLGHAGATVETNSWYDLNRSNGDNPPSDSGEFDGNSVEGSYASIWFDMVDTGNAFDDSMTVPMELILLEMNRHKPQSMLDFWRDWDHGRRNQLAQAFFRHGILRNDGYDLDPGLNPDPNDDILDASRVDGSPVEAVLVNGERDVYEIPMRAGQRLKTSLVYDGDFGTLDVTIYDPDGAELGIGRVNRTATAVATETGTYRVAVTAASPSDASAAYDLIYSREAKPSPDRFEENDDLGAAAPIPRQFSSSAPNVVLGDDDVYAVRARPGDRLRASIRFDHDRGDLNLRLLDPLSAKPELLAESSTSTDGESVNATLTQSGVYYVAVRAPKGVNVDYDLTVRTELANDEFEPNDVRREASPVPMGPGIGFDARLVDGEDDWYTVELVAGEVIDVGLADGEANVSLSLYDGAGTVLTERLDEITYTAETGGRYYIRATPDAGPNPPRTPYRVFGETRITPGTDERFNDDIDNATRVSPGSYQGIDVLESARPDFYAINLTDDTGLEVDVETDRPTDGDVQLYGPARTRVNGTNNPGGVSSTLSTDLIARRTGTYYIRVGGFSRTADEYNLTVDVVLDEGGIESGDSRADALKIGEGQYRDLRMFADPRANGGRGERDVYALEAERNETVTATIQFDPGFRGRPPAATTTREDVADLNLLAYGPGGSVLNRSESLTGTERVGFTPARNGTYHLVVTPVTNRSVGTGPGYAVPGRNDVTEYSLNVSGADPFNRPNLSGVGDRPRLDPTAGARIERVANQLPGREAYEAIEPEELAYHAIDVGPDGPVEVGLGEYTTGRFDLGVVDPEGEPVVDRRGIAGGERVRFTPSVEGRYYVRVSPTEATGATPYALQLSDARPANDRLAPNGGLEAAPVVRPADLGELRVLPGETDIVAVQLVDGETLSALPTSPEGDGPVERLSVAVRGPDGDPLVESRTAAEGPATATATATGRHYVAISRGGAVSTRNGNGSADANGSEPIAYNLSLSATAPEDDPLEDNDMIDDAAPVDPGTYNLALTGHDRDVLAVELRRGETATVTVESERADAIVATVVGPDGVRLASLPVSNGAPDPADERRLSVGARKSGTHYLDLSAPNRQQVSYAVTIDVAPPADPDRFEDNDAFETAAEVDDGLDRVSLTLSPGDRDVFAVEADVGEQVVASTDGLAPTRGRTLTVYGPDGVPLATDPSVGGDGSRVALAAGRTGTYYAVVEGGNRTVPDEYGLTVAVEADGDGTDRFEDNDDAGSAAIVAPDTYRNLTVASGDRDVFAVPLSAGDGLRVAVGPAGGTEAGDIDVRVVRPDGSAVTSASPGPNETATVRVGTDGRAIVEVTAPAGRELDYRLDLDRTRGTGVVGPTADAGMNRTVDPGQTVELNATGSASGREGSELGDLSYEWTRIDTGGPPVNLSGSTTPTPTFTAPNVSARRTLRFGLVVRADGRTDGTSVTVTVEPTRSPFPDGIPGGTTDRPPGDVDGDGLYEDLDGDGTFDFVDVVEFVFAIQRADYGASGVSDAQVEALDYEDDGRVTFVDAIDLVFELQG